MSNGKGMLSDMEFEQQLNELHGDDLGRFTARQLYEHCKHESTQDERITNLENKDKKAFGITGGISGAIGAIIVAALDYFIKPR